MKKLLLFYLVLTFNFSFGQVENYNIFNYSFVFKTQKSKFEDIILEVYRGKKKIISHILLEEEVDCSSVSLRLGDYFVKNNEITFYSYWAVTDRMPTSLMPYGFSKQVYSISKNGMVKLKKSEIYIEDFVDSEDRDLFEGNGWTHKGIKYLTQKPTNKNEQFLLDNYISYIEKKYKSKFVNGKSKKILEKEVRTKLKGKIEEHTKAWENKEIYGNSKN